MNKLQTKKAGEELNKKEDKWSKGLITFNTPPDEDSWVKKIYINNSITEWEYIYDKDGEPLPLTPENKGKIWKVIHNHKNNE